MEKKFGNYEVLCWIVYPFIVIFLLVIIFGGWHFQSDYYKAKTERDCYQQTLSQGEDMSWADSCISKGGSPF